MYLDTTDIAPQLSNLTYAEIEDIIESYYDRCGAALLLKLYDIPFPPKDLSTIFPLLLDEKYICVKCREPMARSHLSLVLSEDELSTPFCKQCETKNKLNKLCEEVLEIRAIAKKTNNSIINLCFKDSSFIKDISNHDKFSLKDLLYLMLLKKSAKSFDHNTVYGLKKNLKLMPFNDGKLLEYLIKKKLISLASSTRKDTLVIQNKKVEGLDIYEAHWKLNLTPEASNFIEIEQLRSFLVTNSGSYKNWREQINKMRLEIAIDECLEFFVVMSEKLGFPLVGMRSLM